MSQNGIIRHSLIRDHGCMKIKSECTRTLQLTCLFLPTRPTISCRVKTWKSFFCQPLQLGLVSLSGAHQKAMKSLRLPRKSQCPAVAVELPNGQLILGRKAHSSDHLSKEKHQAQAWSLELERIGHREDTSRCICKLRLLPKSIRTAPSNWQNDV